jgi:hypothetical protein
MINSNNNPRRKTMAAVIKLTSTRGNTNTEFWWTTTDPVVVSLRNEVLAITNQLNISTEISVSPDQLTCIITYYASTEQQWLDFLAAVAANVPTLTNTRDTYHVNAGHSLTLEARIVETNELVKEMTIVQ